MNDLKIFSSKLFGDMRGYTDGDMEWLCLADVCKAVGIANSRRAIARLNTRGVHKRNTPTESGNQEMTFISEPNVYRLVLRSNKPQAEPFIDWVTSEVLPALRRTGTYSEPHKRPIPELKEMVGERRFDYDDQLTNAIARDVWKAVDKVYLEWLKKATALEALQEFKRQVGRA